jgi:hypothetical protein
MHGRPRPELTKAGHESRALYSAQSDRRPSNSSLQELALPMTSSQVAHGPHPYVYGSELTSVRRRRGMSYNSSSRQVTCSILGPRLHSSPRAGAARTTIDRSIFPCPAPVTHPARTYASGPPRPDALMSRRRSQSRHRKPYAIPIRRTD